VVGKLAASGFEWAGGGALFPVSYAYTTYVNRPTVQDPIRNGVRRTVAARLSQPDGNLGVLAEWARRPWEVRDWWSGSTRCRVLESGVAGGSGHSVLTAAGGDALGVAPGDVHGDVHIDVGNGLEQAGVDS
jgi:hypothetical protein